MRINSKAKKIKNKKVHQDRVPQSAGLSEFWPEERKCRTSGGVPLLIDSLVGLSEISTFWFSAQLPGS